MGDMSYTLVMIVVMVAIFYFFMIRPENKRKRQQDEMRNSLRKGDQITTIGGVIGRIIKVDSDSIVIETSDDRVRMEFAKWAVSNVGVQKSIEDTKKNNKSQTENHADATSNEKEIAAESVQEDNK